MQERYAGKPLLILLENYALDVIGKLPSEKRAQLLAVTQQLWDGGADWKATLRTRLHWDDQVDREILMNWKSFRAAAKKSGQTPDENVFARAFADEFAGDEL